MKRRQLRRYSWAEVGAWAMFSLAAAVYFVSLVTRVSFGTTEWEVSISYGRVSILDEAYFSGESVVPGWSVSGFGWRRPEWWARRQQGGGGGYVYSVPLWFLPIAAAGPVLWLAARHRRVALASMCPSCGYDCTGVPEGAVCPECEKARTNASSPQG